MINAPAKTEANVARTASAPKRPWAKPTIRTLTVVSTRSGTRANIDEDTLDSTNAPGYAPIS